MQTQSKVTVESAQLPTAAQDAGGDLSFAIDKPSRLAPWHVRHSRFLLIVGTAGIVSSLATAAFVTWRTLGNTPLDEIHVRPTTGNSDERALSVVPVVPSESSKSAGEALASEAKAPRRDAASVPTAKGIRAATVVPVPRGAGAVTHTHPDEPV